MGPKAYGLPKSQRIGRRAEFQDIYKRGARLRGRFMTVFVLPNTLGSPRLGIAATRKLGDAVRRNRAKRVVRELFRCRKPLSSLDVVVVPRRELFEAPRPALKADYCATLDRLARTRIVR
jgi:ribonuclease P protein component